MKGLITVVDYQLINILGNNLGSLDNWINLISCWGASGFSYPQKVMIVVITAG